MFLTYIRAYVHVQLDLLLISLSLFLMIPKVRMTSWSKAMIQQSTAAHNDPSFLHYTLQTSLFAILKSRCFGKADTPSYSMCVFT